MRCSPDISLAAGDLRAETPSRWLVRGRKTQSGTRGSTPLAWHWRRHRRRLVQNQCFCKGALHACAAESPSAGRAAQSPETSLSGEARKSRRDSRAPAWGLGLARAQRCTADPYSLESLAADVPVPCPPCPARCLPLPPRGTWAVVPRVHPEAERCGGWRRIAAISAGLQRGKTLRLCSAQCVWTGRRPWR